MGCMAVGVGGLAVGISGPACMDVVGLKSMQASFEAELVDAHVEHRTVRARSLRELVGDHAMQSLGTHTKHTQAGKGLGHTYKTHAGG